MVEKSVSVDELSAKIGPRKLAKLSPSLKGLVMSGGCTLQVDGVKYRAASAEQLALIEKGSAASQPEASAQLQKVAQPASGKRTDVAAKLPTKQDGEPVRGEDEDAADFNARTSRWIRGVPEPEALAPMAAMPWVARSTETAKAKAPTRPEPAHHYAARMAQERLERERARVGGKPAHIAARVERNSGTATLSTSRAASIGRPESVSETRGRQMNEAEQRKRAAAGPVPSAIAARLKAQGAA